ncbi:MAG: class I SAM-dependent methyltransferase [Candidatus Daviesbacteria bacterium]|nr:MAG: class I SAM-dependent methyltransferase [Candidatus Daviesbacteria bacterium]
MIKNVTETVITIFFKVLFLIHGRPEENGKLAKVTSLYKSGGFSELFTSIRLWDAPYEEIAALVPSKGVIADLGCGDGLMVNLLALEEPTRQLIGVEINKDRLKLAKKGLANTKFIYGSADRVKIPKADGILMIHLLHHLTSRDQQIEILKSSYQALKPGGKLIIAEIGKKPFLKYLFTWFTDVVIVPILFEKRLYNKEIFYRTQQEWQTLLKKIGFKVSSKPVSPGKPFSHIILACQK